MRRKVTVVGAGNVGATCALELARRDYADVVLVDIIPNFPQGKALDMNQAGSVLGFEPNILGTNGYDETEGSDVVVITAGKPRSPGMSARRPRDDERERSSARSRARSSSARATRSSIVVSNPLDAMCHVAKATSRVQKQRVVGMAGILDTARFSRVHRLGDRLLGEGRDGDGARRPRRPDGAGRLRDDRRRRPARAARPARADQRDGRAHAHGRRRDRQPARHLRLVRAGRGRGADGRRDHARREARAPVHGATSRASTACAASTWACR